jgi:hypothetical protein
VTPSFSVYYGDEVAVANSYLYLPRTLISLVAIPLPPKTHNRPGGVGPITSQEIMFPQRYSIKVRAAACSQLFPRGARLDYQAELLRAGADVMPLVVKICTQRRNGRVLCGGLIGSRNQFASAAPTVAGS